MEHLTYTGPEFNAGSKIVNLLPDDLLSLLRENNGYIQYGGGLHIRGVCNNPEWHSLEEILTGPLALHNVYAFIEKEDIPFAEDCMGDQFVLRDRKIVKLSSETGDIEELHIDLNKFLEKVSEDPVGFLGMEPLLQLQNEGGKLEPGQLIHVYPPFCSKESANGVSLRAVPTTEALLYLYDFSKKICGTEDGQRVKINVVD